MDTILWLYIVVAGIVGIMNLDNMPMRRVAASAIFWPVWFFRAVVKGFKEQWRSNGDGS